MKGLTERLSAPKRLQGLLLTTVNYYQTKLSPRKGYQCACRQLGEQSCSQHAKHVLQTQSLFVALKHLWQRKQHCTAHSQPFTWNKNNTVRYNLLLLGIVGLTGCGGGGGGDNSGGTTPTEPTPPTTNLSGKVVISSNNTQQPIANLSYTITSASTSQSKTLAAQTTLTTSSDGTFKYNQGDQITFKLGEQSIGPMGAQALITQSQLAQAGCASDNSDCQHQSAQNLKRVLLNIDTDQNSDNGYSVKDASQLTGLSFDLTEAVDVFESKLSPALRKINITPSTRLTFTPTSGINTEELIPEGTVTGQATALVDVFRLATPFKEESCPNIIQYDANGWITKLPSEAECEAEFVRLNAEIDKKNQANSECANNNSGCIPHLKANLYNKAATTFMLRFMPAGSIPEGEYTLIYEGEGELNLSGLGVINNAKTSPITPKDNQTIKVVDVTVNNVADWQRNAGLRLQITSIDESNPIKNIRLVMPGGICTNNPLEHITDPAQCLNNDYQSFASQIAENRNAIIFNPNYLKLLKNFKVVRAMNLMKASPRIQMGGKPLCPEDKYPTDAEKDACVTTPLTWDQRSKMDSAFWGATAKLIFGTITAEQSLRGRYAHGAPLEVIVELMNQLKADPWFTIPHSANDDYVKRFADYVHRELHSDAKVYLEYSNETWNGIFWAAEYARIRGLALNLDPRNNAFSAAYYFHTHRAIEIFKLWEKEFGSSERFVRLLGSKTNDTQTYNSAGKAQYISFMTRNMLERLKERNELGYIDGVAIGPYFSGCQTRAHIQCADTTKVPKLLSKVSNVDDVFDIIDNTNDPYALPELMLWIDGQSKLVKSYGKQLYAYEGGQHITVEHTVVTDPVERDRLQGIFHAAQRDPRMKQRYITLLQAWDDATGGSNPFVLYTIAQGFHDYGTFGLLEHLNQARSDAPKWDGYMTYVEQK